MMISAKTPTIWASFASSKWIRPEISLPKAIPRNINKISAGTPTLAESFVISTPHKRKIPINNTVKSVEKFSIVPPVFTLVVS